MPLHHHTPLLHSRALSLATGVEVWLKMEALQPTGSFKIRGIGLTCEQLAREGARRLVASSGGNAGVAVAYAGRHLGLPVTVVVPHSTPERATALLRQEGAQVIVYGDSWQEAHQHAQALTGEDDALVHPFDDARHWQGHASLIEEVAQQGLRPDAVVLSVGGGGLLCGVAQGLHRQGWQDVPIVAVETDGAASLHAAMAAGQPVELPAITSIATTLGAKQVCLEAWRWTTRHPIHSVLVSDRAAVQACQHFLDDHRVLVEPACGAALAAVSAGDVTQLGINARAVLVVVCGGVGVSAAQLARWSAAWVEA